MIPYFRKLRERRADRILKVLETRHMTPSEIAKEANVPAGSTYAILLLLEKSGEVVSRWQFDGPWARTRPRNRLYGRPADVSSE